MLPYLVAVATVIGCEGVSGTRSTGKPISKGDLVVLIGPARTSPQWAGIAGGARRFIKGYPPLALDTVAPSDNSAAALAQVVRESLAKRPKAICLYVSDPQVAGPAARTITRSGTLLVTMGTDSGVANVFGHVHVGLAEGAEILGQRLEEIADGKPSYLLLHRYGATDTDTHCYERFMHKARSCGGMTLLEECNAAESEQTPAELIRAMFTRFRHAGLVVTLDPTAWLSTPAGELLGGNARFVTLGAAPALWPYLRSGEAAALVGPLDGEIGALAVEIAILAITESDKPGQMRVAELELVNRDTLDDFASRYAEAAGLDVEELSPAPVASRPDGAPGAQGRP